MWKDMDDFENHISKLKDFTKHGLQENKDKLDAKLQKAFNDYKTDLMSESLKKKESNEDPLVREKTLQENLEIMTHCAQQLDKEHRRLKN